MAGKSKGVVEASGRDASGLDHCVGLLCHELPSLQSSGETACAKAARMRALQPEAPSGSSGSLDANHPAMAHAVSVYRSITTDSRPLIRITFSRSGQLEFREEALVDGMFVLYRCADADASPLPVLMGKALRVVAEAPEPFVVLEVWSPLLKEKHQYRPNLFGTWLPGIESQRKALSGRQFLPKKKA